MHPFELLGTEQARIPHGTVPLLNGLFSLFLHSMSSASSVLAFFVEFLLVDLPLLSLILLQLFEFL